MTVPTADALAELQARVEELERRLRLIADVAGGFAPGAARERLDHVRELARELVA